MCSSDCFLIVLAILFPPLPVWVKRGICSCDSLINIALCMLGFVPGLLHAWYIVAKYPDAFDEYDYQQIDQESGQPRGVIVYSATPSRGCGRQQPPPRHPRLVYTPASPPHQQCYGSFNVAPASEPHQAAAGSSSRTGPQTQGEEPPSYASVVKGDNKVQHD
ncbi:hypothetical protein BZA05DRAFT_376574 [Tricharina praecox]|uniref:uncharacterized protein n=1 Tax=Tricharina praecox TaxID=43433 RepID=UPI0022208618|nr:uncharacterized protein BZA05DRAFT_376574 [Tricharina praecox]KAI5847452.1 hypothetical protein BZA05DRAFT_376574 [Tricharina praecox]